ncbi:YhgE/Pip family protein [Lysinimonas soli]|uniref:YhgE/Pip family protein n=1 Tax=Lysinimonas soli TaxID=1074233 RepID=A0ABW0NUA6_9MICO
MNKRLRWIGIAAVALVPLAFVGLYVASVGDAKSGVDRIPAVIVNQDQAITTTNADGTTKYVLAGRQLVTQLTGTKSPGMDWTLSNAADAKTALANGSVYAVLTIPSNFSKSVLSLQGSSPVQARLAIRTDDAHSYLAGSVAQSLSDGMVRTFGSAITKQYISGVYASLGTLGASLSQAADGATQLASGANAAASGASSYAGGVGSYTAGVSSLSSGLSQLNSGAASLDQLSAGVSSYTGGVSQLSAALTAATAALSADPTSSSALAQVQALTAQLAQTAAGGSTLSRQTTGGIDGIQSGIAQSAAGARKLAANGSALVSGANSLASGSAQLASGASGLASGLTSGAAQVPKSDSAAASKAAGVASDPVGISVTKAHAISGVAQAVSTFLLPIALWIGALAVFLVMRPVTRRILASTAASSRVLGSALFRAGTVTAVQAALLVVLMHTAVGIGWQYLPATLVFSLLTAAAFTAFHHLLTVRLGRAGLVISLFLLAVQIAAIGGVYPVQVLTTPFQWISPYLPLTWATTGMQQIVAGGSAAVAIGSAVALLLFGAASVALAALVIRRTRRAGELGLVPAIA